VSGFVKFFSFIKREAVLILSAIAALISAFFVQPSLLYVDYIDFRVLSCLFCLMAVVAGLRKTGIFDRAASALTRRTSSIRGLSAILVIATFFISMAITNDVALITFVPFSLVLMKGVANAKTRMKVIALQTIAANVGSSFTPIGNPQNLFLYSFYRMSPASFFSAIFPVALTGLALLIAATLTVRDEPIPHIKPGANYVTDPKMVYAYFALFAFSVLAVFRVLDYRLALAIVVIASFVIDRSAFRRVDYSLLLTFVFFFVFIGNLQRVERVNAFLTSIVSRNVTVVAALASQAISNVPAAILLSRFTQDAGALLRGVSVGGMGTIIASLASVISFKFFSRDRKGETFKYLGVFTIWNALFLVVLLIVCAFL
jgi:Na+/H+ antiporter NhaD/arsenite permease-like protein